MQTNLIINKYSFYEMKAKLFFYALFVTQWNLPEQILNSMFEIALYLQKFIYANFQNCI